jgi:hypothetical protein
MGLRRALGGALLAAVLGGCSVAGPAVISGGRSAYNTTVNQTEDEQVLAAIVRSRYDQTFGLLAVTSITANIRFSSSLGASAAMGPGSSFEGGTLNAGVAYEENPTISYVPVRGEQFVESLLAPISAEQTLLLSRMSTAYSEPLRLLVRRVNGLVNPIFAPTDPGEGFDRFIGLFTSLRDQGVLDVVRLPDGGHEVLVHDLDPRQAGEVVAMLGTLGIDRRVVAGADLRIPLRFFVGSSTTDAIEVETPTALEVLRAAARGVQVPESHLSAGIVTAGARSRPVPLAVQVSPEEPAQASIAARYRDHWYFIDDRDVASKQAFMLLRTLVGLRLDALGGGQMAPVLTVPVGR